MSAAGTEVWTTRRLQAWIADHLAAREVESPRVMADMLLAHALGCDRMRLYMEVDRPASPDERARLRELVTRAADHEPVQYIVGEAWFFSRPFTVNRTTLIPRPSTETIVEHVLQRRRRDAADPNPRIADVGTGTGVIAISLAAELPGARVVATDVDEAILELARGNAARHGVADRIEFVLGDGAAPLADRGPFDELCSNPPYVLDAEMAELPRNVRDYEPARALAGGPDGLAVVGPIVRAAPGLLRPGGGVSIEIAQASRDAALALARGVDGLEDVDVVKDHEGYWRMLVARATGSR